MRLVRTEDQTGESFIDPTRYLEALPGFSADLPEGARAFATDPEHYNFYGRRCVKDLNLVGITFGRPDELEDGPEWAEVAFRHNCFKHDEDLLITYRGLRAIGLDLDPNHRWGGYDVVILDEVLPDDDGACSHEVAFHSGTLRVSCDDLMALWTPTECATCTNPEG